jgi:hypothetical protein
MIVRNTISKFSTKDHEIPLPEELVRTILLAAASNVSLGNRTRAARSWGYEREGVSAELMIDATNPSGVTSSAYDAR